MYVYKPITNGFQTSLTVVKYTGRLQHSLNVLSNFCSSWKLDVNQEKSKAIVFNSNGKTYMNSFNLKGKHLETVKSYCYL